MEEKAINYNQRVLSLRQLRTLLRKRRTALVPEALADYMRHQIPEIHTPDGYEIVRILNDLIGKAREEFNGILPVKQVGRKKKAPTPKQRLTARERNHVTDFSALLTWTSTAIFFLSLSPGHDPVEHEATKRSAIDLAREGVAWSELGEDVPQRCIAMMTLALHLESIQNAFDEAEQLYRTALELLEGVEKERGAHKVRLYIHYCLGAMLELKGDFSRAADVLQRGQELVATNATATERGLRVGFLALLSAVNRKQGNYALALDYGHQALRWSDSDFDPVAHCKLLQALGLLYEDIEYLEEGLKFLLEAINILEAYGLTRSGIWVYVTTAQQYLKTGDISRGHEILDRAEVILGYNSTYFPTIPDRYLLSFRTIRAHLLITEEEYSRALTILNWIIDNAHELHHDHTEVVACALAATACGSMGEPQRACEYLERAISTSATSSRLHQLRLRLNLATWRKESGELDAAAALLNEIKPELREDHRYYVQLLRLQATLSEKQGDLEDALQLERKASEIERDLLENSRERSIRYARIQAEMSVLEQMVEREKEEKGRLEHELTEMILKLGAKDRLIDEAITLLRTELANSGGGQRELPNERRNSTGIYSILSILQQGEKGSSSSLSYLNTAGDGFLRQLRTSFPNLTTSQERLCSLLHSGLNAGEICTLLGIGSEALKARRKRLRKVFKLKRGESLERFIAAIEKDS